MLTVLGLVARLLQNGLIVAIVALGGAADPAAGSNLRGFYAQAPGPKASFGLTSRQVVGAPMGTGLGSPLRVATGSEASRGLKPFAAAPRPEPMHGASSHPSPRNVASLRSRNQVRFSCLISDSSLLLTSERRFAPTTVRYRRISVRYESEQVSAFIGIRNVDWPSTERP